MTTECGNECKTCLDDPDAHCVTKHATAWMKIYEPALIKCEEQEEVNNFRDCEGLRILLKTLVHNKNGHIMHSVTTTIKKNILGQS